jgi:hypothetical protein
MNKWTTEDFDRLSWHDNHIHGFTLREGGEGVGELGLDIDFIVEWICDRDSGSCDFRIAPATLTFHEVSDLVLSLDYVTTTAALCPDSISEIEREALAYPNGYTSFAWAININWPAGAIRFKASGFTQVLRAEPLVVPGRQYLTADERKSLLA